MELGLIRCWARPKADVGALVSPTIRRRCDDDDTLLTYDFSRYSDWTGSAMLI